ncbi:MAG: 30S ribosomal protein S13 [Candidatus Gracilibacteria bacterium]
MARIAGVNLPKEKRVQIGLTYIFGVGKAISTRILKELNINENKKVQDLTEEEVNKLRERIAKFATEGDLRRKVQADIKHLVDTGTYRGFRHRRGLPVRGQKTRKNARTRKGKKKTVANKKVVTK